MRNRLTLIVVLVATFSAGMWTWRTVHFMTRHDSPNQSPMERSLDPGAVYKVAVGNSPWRGGESPKVTIIAFSDFQCPFCAAAAKTMDQLLQQYGSDLRVAFKHRPLASHENARLAGLAAEAAREQGKFWEMHDKLFANQQRLDPSSLKEYARDLGLDVERFEADLEDARLPFRLNVDLEEAERFAVYGTPAFFINGRPVQGALTVDSFKDTIEKEIQRADAKLANGVPRKELYVALTMNGKTAAEAQRSVRARTEK